MVLYEKPLPPFLYKYTSVDNALKILETKALWFSGPNTFNDPFDCNASLLDFNLTHAEIVEFINEKVEGNRQARRSEIQKNKRDSFRIRNQSREQIQESMNNSGVCCFSEVESNILLWGHYSNNHKGVCLKFNSQVAAIATMSQRVNYQKGYKKVNFWTGKDKAITHLIFTKSEDWQYEKEVRLFTLLQQGIIKFDISLLTEIILGCRIPDIHSEKIKATVRQQNLDHIKFRQAKQTKSSFSLIIK